MNNIRIFQNEQFGQVRIAMNENGEPLFCLVDVCKILGLRVDNTLQRLKEDGYYRIGVTDSLGRIQEAYFINEDGLYDVILDSRKADFANAALKKIRFSFDDIKSLRSFAVLQNIIYYVQGIFLCPRSIYIKIYREVVSVYHSLWRMMFCSKNGYGFSFFISNK